MMAESTVLDFRSPANEDASQALHGVWKDFIGSIAGIGKGIYNTDKEMNSVLNHNMVLIHSLLMNSSNYRGLVNSSFRRLTRTKNWGWKTIHEDSLGKVGLFSVYRNAPVPLHDHPGSKGALMVIEGEVEIERYTLQEPYRQTGESGMVELERCDRKVLKPFDISWFGAEAGNVHGMQALTEQCVMLKVQMVHKPVDRSWYFPVFSIERDQRVLSARRIVSRYL